MPARQRARELANTPEFHAQRQRKKVEALFAELKNQIGLRRLRLRRLRFVREQFSGGTEHQATSAVPQPTDETAAGGHMPAGGIQDALHSARVLKRDELTFPDWEKK